MKSLAETQPQPMRAPDPILAELWEVKRQLNEAAGYRVKERARMAHEATLQVEARWHELESAQAQPLPVTAAPSPRNQSSRSGRS